MLASPEYTMRSAGCPTVLYSERPCSPCAILMRLSLQIRTLTSMYEALAPAPPHAPSIDLGPRPPYNPLEPRYAAHVLLRALCPALPDPSPFYVLSLRSAVPQELLPDSKTPTHMLDPESSRFVFAKCQALGIRITVVTRIAASELISLQLTQLGHTRSGHAMLCALITQRQSHPSSRKSACVIAPQGWSALSPLLPCALHARWRCVPTCPSFVLNPHRRRIDACLRL